MRVRISDLLLWQWKPSIWTNAMNVDYGDDKYGPGYNWRDELIIRDLIRDYLKGDPIPPISILPYSPDHWLVESGSLTPLGLKLFKSGKWCVENGFHRIYAQRRLGRKIVEAED